MKTKQQLEQLAKSLDRLALDVSEIRIAVDADYQAERLRLLIKQLRDIAGTQIHGGGTGND